MKKTIVFCLVVLLAVTTGAYAKDFPKKNITNVVVWGAGGGTDTCNRIISAEMAKFLDVNINVINKTGGVAGSVGMNYGYSRPHDGYTLTAFPNPMSPPVCRVAGTRNSTCGMSLSSADPRMLYR